MRNVILLFAALFFCTHPAFAGDPGQDFWTLVEIRKENWEIDDQATKIATDLRAGNLTAAQAETLWQILHRKTEKLRDRSEPFESGEQPEVAREVTKMLRLQNLRLEGLIEAAQVESKSGIEAARPLWNEQLQSYKAYQAQEQKVLDLMNWVEENP